MTQISLSDLSMKYQCTCAVPGEYVHPNSHEHACDLYNCDEWVECMVQWDNVVGGFYANQLHHDTDSLWDDDVVLDKVDDVLDAVALETTDGPITDDDKRFIEWWTKKNEEVVNATAKATEGMATSGKKWGKWKSCKHEQTPVTFPDGTTVYCHSVVEDRDWIPDYALYLDASQCYDAECIAYFLPWQDYGLPTIEWERADALVEEVFDLAWQGYFIEMGCYGAHGRTGVVLGMMAIHAGVPVDEAVKWVRTNYCTHAIEGADQEWYVRRYGALKLGLEVPPRPPKPKPTPKPMEKPEASVNLPKALPAKTRDKKRRNRKRGRRRNRK